MFRKKIYTNMRTYLQHLESIEIKIPKEVFEHVDNFFCELLKIKDEELPDGTPSHFIWYNKNSSDKFGGASYSKWYGADEKHYGIKVKELSWTIDYMTNNFIFYIYNNEESNHPLYSLISDYVEHSLGEKGDYVQRNVKFYIPINNIDILLRLNSKAIPTFTTTRKFDL